MALVETNPSESHAEPYQILQTLNVSPESIVLKAGQIHATVVVDIPTLIIVRASVMKFCELERTENGE